MQANLSFREHVCYCTRIQRYGYYTIRRMILKHGGNLADITEVLIMRLAILAK